MTTTKITEPTNGEITMQIIRDGQVQFPKQVECAVGITKKEMEENSGEIWPRALVFKTDEKLEWMHVDPTMMARPSDKAALAAMLVKKCFEPDTLCVIFLSDGMVSNIPDDISKTALPQDMMLWPKHYIRETLLITINAQKMQGITTYLNYERDENDKRIFAADFDHDRASVGNRFCFDLRVCIESEAVMKELARGRKTIFDNIK